MSNVTPLEVPSLFSPELLSESATAPEEKKENTSARIAREFVRWCWSFGSDFRNSPDLTNFRFWQHKNGTTTSPLEDDEILVEARRLFLRKLELSVRKVDVPKTAD